METGVVRVKFKCPATYVWQQIAFLAIFQNTELSVRWLVPQDEPFALLIEWPMFTSLCLSESVTSCDVFIP